MAGQRLAGVPLTCGDDDMSEPAVPNESDCPPIRSRGDFLAAVAWVVQQTVALRARQIVCVADSFDEWPLDDAAVLDALTPWLRLPQRRLVLLGRDFESIRGAHPRFMAWRKDWSHALDAWTPPEEMGPLPTLVLSDCPITLQVMDTLQWRGRVSVEGRKAYLLREQIDAYLQRSERAFPVHHLGL
jgi:hypothetical protein